MNYKRKRPKLHTVYTCGTKCRFDRVRLSGNHPRLYSVRDRKKLYTISEQLKDFKLC